MSDTGQHSQFLRCLIDGLSKGFYRGQVRVGICILSSSCIHSRSPRSPIKQFGIKYAHGLFCLQSYIQHGQIKYVRWSQIIFCNIQEILADTHEGRPKNIFCQGITGQTFYYWVLKTFETFGMFKLMVQTKSWTIKTNKYFTVLTTGSLTGSPSGMLDFVLHAHTLIIDSFWKFQTNLEIQKFPEIQKFSRN